LLDWSAHEGSAYNTVSVRGGIMFGVQTRVALIAGALAVSSGLTATSQATIYRPALDPIPKVAGPNITYFDWSTTPAYDPTFSWYSDNAHVDIGNQSPANVETVLESPAWINMPLNFVSGGACTIPTNCIAGANNSGTWTYAGVAANVFGIHFGDNFIALLFANALTSFTITGLPHGVSNIYALNTVPLPGALLLFGTGVALMGFFNWLRRGGNILGRSAGA